MTMNSSIPTAERLYFSGEKFDATELERLERAFFSTLVVQNGTFKTTNHRRLDNLNELVQKHLPPERPLKLMDVAVSSGISTAEWMTSLENAGVDYHMVAGDLFVQGFLVSLGNGLNVLVDKTGNPIQFDIRGRAIGTPLGRRARALHPIAIWRLQRAARQFDMVRRSVEPAALDRALAEHWGLKYRAVKLVSPSLSKFASLEVVEDDILVNRNYKECFQVIRAANILNLGYFERPILTAMLLNLRSRLTPGGMLIVCRTNHQDVNNGSVFSLKSDGSFSTVARLNAGSEVEEIVLTLPRDAASAT
jgi:hypothetical protein